MCRGRREWKEKREQLKGDMAAELNKGVSRRKVKPFFGHRFGFGFGFGFWDSGISGIGTPLYKVGGLSPKMRGGPLFRVFEDSDCGNLRGKRRLHTHSDVCNGGIQNGGLVFGSCRRSPRKRRRAMRLKL